MSQSKAAEPRGCPLPGACSALVEIERLRALCAALGSFHGGMYDPQNAQIILNYSTDEDAAAAWESSGKMQDDA